MKIKLLAFSLLLLSQTIFAASICRDARIIDKNNTTGSIQEIFSNGMAIVLLDEQGLTPYYRKLTDLSGAVAYKGKYHINDRILDLSNSTGTIKEIFDNGLAKVMMDGKGINYRIVALSELAKGYKCVEAACTKDRFLDSNNSSGTIMEIFDNGVAKVMLDRKGLSLYDRSLKDLGYAVSCSLKSACLGKNL